jgi:hypothetical protein
MIHNMKSRFFYFSFLLALGLLAPEAVAQTPVAMDASTPGEPSSDPVHSVSVVGGAFNYDGGSDDYFPLVGIRADRSLSRFIVAEAGLSYAAVASALAAFADETVRTLSPSTPILTADLGVQFQLPLPHVRPYIGASVGAIARGGDDQLAARFVRPSYSAAGGVRVDLFNRLGLRAEIRVRQDEHPQWVATDFEETVGLSWRF